MRNTHCQQNGSHKVVDKAFYHIKGLYKMPITAWFMDADTAADQRLPHKQEPNKPVSREELAALGVLSWEGLDADK